MERRKIFLDIGGHNGETVSRFYGEVENAETWKIYSFEPHPKAYETLSNNMGGRANIKCINAAVSGKSATNQDFYCGGKNGGEGSTLVPGKVTGKVDYENPIKVKSISLTEFVKMELEQSDHVVLKMNVEGGEYEIMQHILTTGIMSRFAQIFVELHRKKTDLSNNKEYEKIEKAFVLSATENDVDVFYFCRNVIDLRPINYSQPDMKKRMKVAHFAEFGPHKSGLYGTTRDMIMAERSVGIDAVLVDVQVINGQTKSRKNLYDGDLKIANPNWAIDADILVHHSCIHNEIKKLGIPIVLAIHGRPESTFLLEHRRINAVYGLTAQHGKDNRYKAFITFWDQYMFHLGLQVPKEKLFYVPAMVDLDDFNPKGPTHTFAGSPSLLIVDMWRQDVTPFNVIMAAARFKEKYGPDAKVHILGAQPKKKSMQSLTKILKKDGILGEVLPLVESTAMCYRGADIVITPHNIATRVVRESLACGTPIVAGTGNPYTPFTADSRDTASFAHEIHKCWTWIKAIEKKQVVAKVRGTAEREFNPEQSGLAAKSIYEKIIKDNETKWIEQGKLHRKQYSHYDAYLAEQKSKLTVINQKNLADYEKKYHVELRKRLKGIPKVITGHPTVLCLGARTGIEVEAFLDVGCFAVGIDLNPGKDNKYVVTGDFHNLSFPAASVDIVFTNSMDHVYRIRRLLREVKRVLKPNGTFLVESHGLKEKKKLALTGVTGADRWASLWWESFDDLISTFADNGFHVTSDKKVIGSDCYVERQFCFQDGGAK